MTGFKFHTVAKVFDLHTFYSSAQLLYKEILLITIMTMVMDNFATFSFAFVSLDLPFVCWFPVHRPFEAAKIIWNFDFKNWKLIKC